MQQTAKIFATGRSQAVRLPLEFRFGVAEVFIRRDPAGNIKADKAKSTEKIDGAVATIMALDRAIRCGNTNSASVYDDRGILFI